MELSKTITSNPAQGPANRSGGHKAQFSDQLLEKARVNIDTALKDLESRFSGLGSAEVEARLRRYGWNEIAREKRPSPLARLWNNVKNPKDRVFEKSGGGNRREEGRPSSHRK